MNMTVTDVPARAPVDATGAPFPDPLSEDLPGDELVVTTRRAIGRVALVAVETAGRFERDALSYDPMSWLLAPRAVFDGAPAIDACLSRADCLRGIMVHGLGLALDVDRPAVDALLADDDDDDLDDAPGADRHDLRHRHAIEVARVPGRRRRARLRLYTAVVADCWRNAIIQAFHASYATGRDEVVERLARVFGSAVAEDADVRPGFHPASPLVVALVPDAVADMIRRMERQPVPGNAATFVIDIQQCIRA